MLWHADGDLRSRREGLLRGKRVRTVSSGLLSLKAPRMLRMGICASLDAQALLPIENRHGFGVLHPFVPEQLHAPGLRHSCASCQPALKLAGVLLVGLTLPGSGPDVALLPARSLQLVTASALSLSLWLLLLVLLLLLLLRESKHFTLGGRGSQSLGAGHFSFEDFFEI